MTDSIEPIMKVTWLCPHCLTEYEDEQDVIACSNTPIVPAKFKEGDTVYVRLYYPEDGKLFAEVQVKEVLDDFSSPGLLGPQHDGDFHQPLYVLSHTVRHYKDAWIGGDPRGWTKDQYLRPARQDQLLQMGESDEDGAVVSPDTVIRSLK